MALSGIAYTQPPAAFARRACAVCQELWANVRGSLLAVGTILTRVREQAVRNTMPHRLDKRGWHAQNKIYH